ncbi:phosphoethanolamine transferase [Pectinatus brassicae]|uniref:Heptose-I-phosphate ethanolaminephosphotransferase n=1 Tax=Pectinatus brassicae TaxID=862415 RepID=A0A840UW18_9FIRM|nr:phosphoethanolamine transferase [Pectinatus brassicae]MBB5336625.1 heptose-I-phosphate ethanolaminephosphotransferase [Pectinatus brassicae]
MNIIKKFAAILQQPAWHNVLKNNMGFIIGLFLFNYFSIARSLWQIQEYKLMLLDGLFLLAVTLIISIILTAIPSGIIRKILSNSIFYICALLCLAEFFSFYNYNAPVGAGIITALLETNSEEASEFFQMYIGWHWLIYTFIFALFTFILQKNFLAKTHLKIYQPRLGYIMGCIIVLGILSGVCLVNNYKPFIKSNDLDIPIVRVYASAQTAVANMKSYGELNNKMAASKDITANNSTIPNIVFILGEATNRNHMHLYGYPLPNTPNLDNLNKNQQLAVFKDCISPHSTTVAVLRDLFTFCDAESQKPWYQYNNLIDIMQQAGYKTYWLSNQESSGIWGNVALLYANRSTVHQFTSVRDSHEASNTLDGALFPIVDKAIANHAVKNFYVIHLMGGHSLYYKRFPYIFSKFSKNDIPRNVSDEKKVVLAQYTNALYYNDYIVSGIIDKFKQQNAIIIYLPDHGETVYDDNSNFAGHVEENPNHYMLEVPMIMWASDKFKQAYPAKWLAIKNAVQRPYMTDDMIHTVLDIADIKTTEYKPAKSIINPLFNATRPRMVQGKNYDTQIRFAPAQ